MLDSPSPVIETFVSQHLDDADALRSLRRVQIRSPDVTLKALGSTDERLAAHLDGLSIAGDFGAQLVQESLADPSVGRLFVAMVLAIWQRDGAQIERMLSLAEVLPDAQRAFASAFGWVPAPTLRGITLPLLSSKSPVEAFVGIAACAQHRVNPGEAIQAAIRQPHACLRARALRAAGELGRVDLLPDCLALLNDADPNCRLAAAWAAVLLRDRGAAVAELRQQALTPEPMLEALAMFLLSANPADARTLVQQLAAQGSNLRVMIKAAAWAGDVQVIPWLLKHMEHDSHARLAGEAFSFISGVDPVALDMEHSAPGTVDGGPNDDPADADVAMDEDEGLPWPDVEKISAWWQANGSRFRPGTRYFVGEPPSVVHCISVLKHGFQRQRIAAAQYLCLLKPGTPLFNVAAPAWRQQRLLAEMGA
jgi:uncharacterized protein (TIGR02270 family)